MPQTHNAVTGTLDKTKFCDPDLTRDGAARAKITLQSLQTLWVNTGTLCNITCENCYIESSPTNDRLVYFSLADLEAYLDEIDRFHLGTELIAFTGGEPFMNPEMLAMARLSLEREHDVLVLTNAMQPMMRKRVREGLKALRDQFGQKLKLRVSLDHYTARFHNTERGKDSFAQALKGVRWLSEEGFTFDIAGRTCWQESEASLREGFSELFRKEGIALDVYDPSHLLLFPEMDANVDVPEITTECWNILGVNPDDMMCASSRMVVKRKGCERPSVLACTLLPYDTAFELGHTLKDAQATVALNHPHCARFCVLGGGSCTA